MRFESGFPTSRIFNRVFKKTNPASAWPTEITAWPPVAWDILNRIYICYAFRGAQFVSWIGPGFFQDSGFR